MSDQPEPAKPGAVEGMLCPVCRVSLVMSERQGIEIDYCPKCRGVWLDRGELDKIIERSEQEQPAAAPQYPAPGAQAQPAPSFLPQGPSAPWGGPAQPQGPQPAPYPSYPPGSPGSHGDPHHDGPYGGPGGGHYGEQGGFLSRLFR